MLVGVLAANEPARAFYERVGGVLLGERDVDDSGSFSTRWSTSGTT
jgi:hypothetical protein